MCALSAEQVTELICYVMADQNPVTATNPCALTCAHVAQLPAQKPRLQRTCSASMTRVRSDQMRGPCSRLIAARDAQRSAASGRPSTCKNAVERKSQFMVCNDLGAVGRRGASHACLFSSLMQTPLVACSHPTFSDTLTLLDYPCSATHRSCPCRTCHWPQVGSLCRAAGVRVHLCHCILEHGLCLRLVRWLGCDNGL